MAWSFFNLSKDGFQSRSDLHLDAIIGQGSSELQGWDLFLKKKKYAQRGAEKNEDLNKNQ